MPQLKFNAELSQHAIDEINHHPQSHQQDNWHSDCGTAHCWYGWCEVLSDVQIKTKDEINTDPMDLIGIEFNSWEWQCIVNGDNTIKDIEKYHNELTTTNTIIFDKDGFDKNGFTANTLDRK